VRTILQKHGKIIMAILGVILMFVFALPTFRGMSAEDLANMKVATLNGRKVTNQDVRSAEGELGMLFGLNLLGSRTQLGYSGSPDFERSTIVISQFGGEEQDRATYWMLLTEEASHYAFTSVSPEEVHRAVATAVPPEEVDPIINKVLKDHGTGMLSIQVALSHLEMVEQYLSFLMSMGPRPITAYELRGDEDLRKVNLKFAAIDGTTGWVQASAPAADQLGKQFDLYKHTVRMPMPPADAESPGPQPAAIDGHNYPFGYKYPDRVTVEYLKFDRAAIRALVKLTPDDEKNAYGYYRAHPQEFQTTTDPATAPATSTAPGTASAPASTQPTTRPWADVRKELLDRQLDQRTDTAMTKMVQTATGLAGDPWKNNPNVSKDKWASYQDVAAAIAGSADFFKYKPDVATTEKGPDADKRDKGLMGPEELRAIPGIGDAIYLLPVGNQVVPVPFSMLATHVQELVKSDPKDPLSRLNLQVGMEGPPLRDKDGNQYLYRVTTADPTHEPASIDEVKAQVVEDLKKRDVYEKTVAAVKDALSKNPRVTAVADQYKAKVEAPQAFSRVDSPLPAEIQAIPDFVKAAFLVDQTAQTRPANITQPGPGTAVLAVDSTLHCYPIEVIDFTKPTGADFAKQMASLLQGGDPSLQRFLGQYMTIEALSERLHYVPDAPPKKPATTAASK